MTISTQSLVHPVPCTHPDIKPLTILQHVPSTLSIKDTPPHTPNKITLHPNIPNNPNTHNKIGTHLGPQGTKIPNPTMPNLPFIPQPQPLFTTNLLYITIILDMLRLSKVEVCQQKMLLKTLLLPRMRMLELS